MYAECKKLLVEKCDKVLKIQFNNPAKKNTLNLEAYDEIGRVLRAAAQDETLTIVVFTGVGDFFTSGNDLSINSNNNVDMSAHLERSNLVFRELVESLIDCPKITIALVNGPAIGIGATLAGLCDLAWCTEQAYFYTPFTKLGLAPEACSSYIFPMILGRSKATELLLLSEKMSSKEAYERGFVSKIYAQSDFNEIVWPKIMAWSELPPISMMQSKKLVRMIEQRTLYEALRAESAVLAKQITSEEFFNALMAFSMRKNKSKL